MKLSKSEKPIFIFSNLAISLDGKIATQERCFLPLGSIADRREMQKLRARADAVLMGAASLRSYAEPCTVRQAQVQPVQLLLSSGLERISLNWPYFQDPSIKRVLYVGDQTPSKKIRRFEKQCEIVLLKASSKNLPIPRQIIRDLQKRNLQRLLVEGGGTVMWEFIRLKLIQEFYVTLTPQILGGKNSPTLVDGQGFLPGRQQKLRLLKVRRLGDELYLHYQLSPSGHR